jgi:hypothetical protein
MKSLEILVLNLQFKFSPLSLARSLTIFAYDLLDLFCTKLRSIASFSAERTPELLSLETESREAEEKISHFLSFLLSRAHTGEAEVHLLYDSVYRMVR